VGRLSACGDAEYDCRARCKGVAVVGFATRVLTLMWLETKGLVAGTGFVRVGGNGSVFAAHVVKSP